MKTIGYMIIVTFAVLLEGCTLNFKAKEIELETIPPISYQLNGMNIAGWEVYHGPD